MAVWSPSTDSSSIRIIVVLVIATTLLSSAAAAPTSSGTHAEPWWYNPCFLDIDELKQPTPPMRHSRSANNDKVITELNIFINDIQKHFKSIKKLYGSDKQDGPKIGKFQWLKIKKFYSNLEKNKNATLIEFYKSLHYFAGTIEKLRSVTVKTESHFNHKERKHIYRNVTYLLRNLLCTVRESILDKKQKLPPPIPVKKMKIQLENEISINTGTIYDINFFTKLKTFMRRARKILKSRKHAKKSKAMKKSVKVVPKRT